MCVFTVQQISVSLSLFCRLLYQQTDANTLEYALRELMQARAAHTNALMDPSWPILLCMSVSEMPFLQFTRTLALSSQIPCLRHRYLCYAWAWAVRNVCAHLITSLERENDTNEQRNANATPHSWTTHPSDHPPQCFQHSTRAYLFRSVLYNTDVFTKSAVLLQHIRTLGFVLTFGDVTAALWLEACWATMLSIERTDKSIKKLFSLVCMLADAKRNLGRRFQVHILWVSARLVYFRMQSDISSILL